MVSLASEVQIQLLGSLARDQNAAGGLRLLAVLGIALVIRELILLDLLEIVLGYALKLGGAVFIRHIGLDNSRVVSGVFHAA